MEEKALTVIEDQKEKEARVFATISYENQLSLLDDDAAKNLKRAFKNADKVMKRKAKEFARANRPKTMFSFLGYIGANLVLPIVIGGLVGLLYGAFVNIGSIFNAASADQLGNIDPLISMMIHGAVNIGIVRVLIEVVKLPWKRLGFDQEDSSGRVVSLINSIINFFPNIISRLAPEKEKKGIEEYIESLEQAASAKSFMKDPEIKAKLFMLRFLYEYEVTKAKAYNYKLLHSFKGFVKYGLIAGGLSMINPLSSVFPIRTLITAISGAITEFILKRNVDKTIVRDIQRKNADYKLITKKMDEEQKEKMIGYAASKWFGITPESRLLLANPSIDLESES